MEGRRAQNSAKKVCYDGDETTAVQWERSKGHKHDSTIFNASASSTGRHADRCNVCAIGLLLFQRFRQRKDRTSTMVVSPEKQCIEFTSFFFFPFWDMRGQALHCLGVCVKGLVSVVLFSMDQQSPSLNLVNSGLTARLLGSAT